MSNIRLRLPVLRMERRLSQRRLAVLAGLRPDTVSALERGESAGIRFDTLARICEVLDCTPGDLLEFEADSHHVPVLGGPDEEKIIRQRLSESGRVIDGPSFMAELLGEAKESKSHSGKHR